MEPMLEAHSTRIQILVECLDARHALRFHNDPSKGVGQLQTRADKAQQSSYDCRRRIHEENPNLEEGRRSHEQLEALGKVLLRRSTYTLHLIYEELSSLGESVRSGDRSFEPLIGHGQSQLLGDHILIGLCVLILIRLCVPGRNLTLRWLRFSIIAHDGSEQKGKDRTEGQQVCCADGQWTICSLERHGSADERHAKNDANHKRRGGQLRRSCKKQRHLFECWRWCEHWRWR